LTRLAAQRHRWAFFNSLLAVKMIPGHIHPPVGERGAC
jgi:hypothetical protein